jgi:hypothetical protein
MAPRSFNRSLRDGDATDEDTLSITMRAGRAAKPSSISARLQARTKHTLNRWRVTGEGPPFVTYGPRLVRCLEAALTDWEKRRTRRSTSDVGADASFWRRRALCLSAADCHA